MIQDVSDYFVNADSTIRDTMKVIDRQGEGIALVVDNDGRLLGTVTDGDIRRAILGHLDLDLPVAELLARRDPRCPAVPITAGVETPSNELLKLMKKHVLRQVPLVDEDGRVQDIALLSRMVEGLDVPLNAVVMAGGLGKRLRPLTEDLPKPMLPVGERPLLELIVEQLREAGVRRLSITTHHRSEVIARHFGDGGDFGVDISYVREDDPRGTAGALCMLEPSQEPLLVMNGDILTTVDFRAMLSFHLEHQADMTVAVKPYEISVPYGVVECDGVEIKGIVEKPVIRHFVNAGIYLLNPELCRLVPSDRPYDVPDLIELIVSKGHRVVSFPIREYWLDIGSMEHYEKAIQDVKNGAISRDGLSGDTSA